MHKFSDYISSVVSVFSVVVEMQIIRKYVFSVEVEM